MLARRPNYRTTELKQSIANHEKALVEYQSGNWLQATQLFTAILQQTNHTLHRVYLQRMEASDFQQPDDWEGIYTHTSK